MFRRTRKFRFPLPSRAQYEQMSDEELSRRIAQRQQEISHMHDLTSRTHLALEKQQRFIAMDRHEVVGKFQQKAEERQIQLNHLTREEQANERMIEEKKGRDVRWATVFCFFGSILFLWKLTRKFVRIHDAEEDTRIESIAGTGRIGFGNVLVGVVFPKGYDARNILTPFEKERRDTDREEKRQKKKPYNDQMPADSREDALRNLQENFK